MVLSWIYFCRSTLHLKGKSSLYSIFSHIPNIYIIIVHSGEECTCEVKRMYLTIETFSILWYPLLMSLGVYCLCDGLLFGYLLYKVKYQQLFWLSGSILTRKRTKQGGTPSTLLLTQYWRLCFCL